MKEQFFSAEILNSMSIDITSVLFIVIYCTENKVRPVMWWAFIKYFLNYTESGNKIRL